MKITTLDLQRAYSRTRNYRNVTPLIKADFLRELWDAEVWMKCEQFQQIGAFKIRGAANFTLQMSAAERAKGIATHSSGNHAQAVAYMAHRLGIKAYVVMPSNSNKVKIENARRWGAEITLCEPTFESRIATVNQVADKYGTTIVPPFDHEWIIEGQATCAMEILAEQRDLDCIVAPLGGGGLLAGSSLASHHFSGQVSVIGAEPTNAADGYEGFKSGKRVTSFTPHTVADGLRTTVGEAPFPIICEHVNDILLAKEENILPWMKRIWKETKLLIEPSCAVPFAAIDDHRELVKGKKIAIIITGGNVDISAFY